MSNPASTEIFGIDPSDLASILTTLGLPATADARLASYRLIEHLSAKLFELTDGAGDLATYQIAKTVNNVDLDTQVQSFTFTYRLALTVSSLEDES